MIAFFSHGSNQKSRGTQLERLLRNPHFHKSKRFPVFLKFVVTEALAGRADNLKERTLGVEVFGKDPNYDTTDDPIVRVTAGEIRKRIAQYYQEPGHEHEIMVLLPAGSYAPHFRFPEEVKSAAKQLAQVFPAVESSRPNSVVSPVPKRAVSWRQLVTAFVVLAVAIGTIFAWRALRPSAMEQFWAPFVKSPDPVLFCIADQSQYSTINLRDAANPLHQTTLNDHMITVIIDDISPWSTSPACCRLMEEPTGCKARPQRPSPTCDAVPRCLLALSTIAGLCASPRR